MMKTTSIGIRQWAGEMDIWEVWSIGEGDSRLIGWRRGDGEHAIETNADPVWESDEGFQEMWAHGTMVESMTPEAS